LDVRLGMPLAWPRGYETAVAVTLVALTGVLAWAAGRIAPPQYFAPPPEDPPQVALLAETAAVPLDEEIPPGEPATDEPAPVEPPQPVPGAAQDFQSPEPRG
jgi:hypothetical protein